jgi:hypothetical protein
MIKSLNYQGDNMRAAAFILEYAYDTPHHRQWGIDQALRLLLGETYLHVIDIWETRTGEEWSEGIAP